MDAYRKKKKEKKNQPSSSSGLNFAKNEDHQNALGGRVSSKPPFLVADDDEPKGDDSMKMTFTTTTKDEEEGETANTTETFAFTMAPDAVRYSNGNTKGEEDIVAHASPIRPAAPAEQPRRGIEEEEEGGVAAFMSPPPPRFSFDESYNAAGGSMMEEEATPPVKMNMRGFEEQEDADIDRKKMSSLDESFDPEEYVNRFVTP